MSSTEITIDKIQQRISGTVPVINAILKTSGAPGLSIGVALGNETVHTSHYGYRDVENTLVADDDTRYAICSLTKGIVSTLAGIYVEEGYLGWDSKVHDILPDFRSISQEVQQKTTLEDLLSHRTGIASIDPLWLGSNNNLLVEKEDTLSVFATLPSVKPFRECFVYNNWGYDIAGMMLEEVTGRSVSELLQARIFGPLDMTRTSTTWDTPADNVAKAYGVSKDLEPILLDWPQLGRGTIMEAAGGIKSTITDLLKFYSSFVVAMNAIATPDSDAQSSHIFSGLQRVIRHKIQTSNDARSQQDYTLGSMCAKLPCQLGKTSQNQVIGQLPVVGEGSSPKVDIYHNGSMPGSHTAVHVFPESQITIVVLQNSLAPLDVADLVSQLLGEAIFDFPKRNDYEALTTEFVKKTLKRMDVIATQLRDGQNLETAGRPLTEYAGKYFNASGLFMLEVVLENGQLFVLFQGSQLERYNLSHYHHDIFSWHMDYDTAAKRGRYVNDGGPEFYLLKFQSNDGYSIDSLTWAWDPDRPQIFETFRRL